METMQPVMKYGRYAWDKINMPGIEFQKRAEVIRKEMQREGIDVLLVYGKGADEYGNSCYLSNHFSNMLQGSMVVLHGRDEAALLIQGFSRGLPVAKSMTWIDQVRAGRDISQECIKYLNEKRLMPSTVGLVGLRESLPYHQWQAIRESLKECRLADAGHIITRMRMVKSQRERDQIRRSSRVVSQALDLFTCGIYPDADERALQAAIERSAYLEGAEDCRVLLARPLDGSWAFRPAEDMAILPGGSVIVYVAVELERYWAEEIRTFIANPPHFVEVESQQSRSLFKGISSEVKPGRKSSEVYEKIIGKLQKKKVDYISEIGFGQGIGLGLGEFPTIGNSDFTELEEGMCLTLRLPVSDKKLGAHITGHTICLSEKGAEILTSSTAPPRCRGAVRAALLPP